MYPSDARKQALAESRLFGHLAAFAVVTSVLVGVNLVVGGPLWAGWIGVAWALVVTSHASAVFGHVLGRDWIDRRAAALRSTDALGQIEHRLGRLEAGAPVGTPRPVTEAEDPFDLDAAMAVGRPVAPEHIGAPREAEFADDPFAMSREPIDTPRLDGPAGRA